MGEETFFTTDQLRLLCIGLLSSITSFFAPTGDAIVALCIMFSFNIFCGLRADGVSIKKCKNFSMKKFMHAIMELLVYLSIIETIFAVMVKLGDKEAAQVAIKSISYVFMYVYMQNAFKNLITAYPKSLALRLIYHVIRFEFARALPSHLQPIIDRLNNEFGDDKEKAETAEQPKKKRKPKDEDAPNKQ